MKTSEIKQKLESKSRDELNIIAKKLKIKNHRKQKIGDLISTILNKDTKFVASILHVTWWDLKSDIAKKKVLFKELKMD